MDQELEQLRRELEEKRPLAWDALPDIPLYMDQVLTYMDRQLIKADGSDSLTSAMVNNYTKSGLVPRAAGKKYSRDHLAYLTAICILKQVMPAKDMALLLEEETSGGEPVGELYEQFRESLDQALRSAAGEMEDYMDQASLSRGALHFALLSYAAGLVSRHYVGILRESRQEPAPTRREKREKKSRHTEAGAGETQG